ncbi:MAG: hypothetical protein IKW99_07715 [Bacteroidales bacterium]|nr:hypothetical protein [Bacteroidales bacterium]
MIKLFKRIAFLFLLAAVLCACGEKVITGVSFPGPPIEIASNESFGMGMINYYNIIQGPDGTYRMYFAANENSGIAEDEWHQNLYLAESSDGFHYELKGKIMESLIEQSVCLVKDKDWPYRLIGNQLLDGKHCLCLWKSKDGIEFTGRKVLFDFKHDTQNTLTQHGSRMKLYSRLTQEHYQNRRITLAEFTLDGEQVSETEILAGDCLYNSAASKVDERYDLLFPTYYNTHGGTTDTCSFRCYLADGSFMRELPCELNRWVDESEEWALASPGFIFINGDRYLAFATRTASHDHSHTGMISRYKLIKVVLEYE